MKILRHGTVFVFRCDSCGCVFVEAKSKTNIANEGIWSSERKDHGTRKKCPDCGNDVIGFEEQMPTVEV